MSESGYVALTLSQLHLSFSQSLPQEELSLRVDVEICNNKGVFLFAKTNESKFSSAVGKAALLAIEGGEEEEQPLEGGDQEGEAEMKEGNDDVAALAVARPKAAYVLGLDDLYLKTGYIDLNAEVLNALANASISIKVMGVGMGSDSAASAAVAAPVKGKAPAAAAPTSTGPSDECLLEVLIPLKDLLTAKGNSVSGHSFSESNFITIHNQAIMTDSSSLTYSLICDNDMAEYAMGCVIAQWAGASMACPPPLWSLHHADAVDAKAKVPPTAVELRAKYLENICRLVGAQESVATYSLVIGSAPAEPSGEAEPEPSLSYIHAAVMPQLSLGAGKIAFNAEAAAEVSPDDDIRSRCDLWSISWSASSCVFIHRSAARQLAKIALGSSATQLPVRVTKTPSAEGAASEGSEVVAEGTVDVSRALLPGSTGFAADITGLTGADLDAPGVGFACSALFASTAPIKRQDVDTAAITSRIALTKPSEVTSGRQVSLGSQNRDVLQELRDEIASTVRQIAREYVALYPSDLSGAKDASAAEEHDLSAGGRKAEFMYFLSTNGIYHDFKERLKPRIQRVVRDRYGARGAALGKTASGFAGEGARADTQKLSTDQLLGELYVFLVKESNCVLNEIYGSTTVDRDVQQLDQPALIDDEIESPRQSFDRVSSLASDAESDGRLLAAEQLHLENIQAVANTAELGSQSSFVFSAYAGYGKFLLRAGAAAGRQAAAQSADAADALHAQAAVYADRARQALSAAVGAKPDEWGANLLLSCTLFESDQLELAECALLAAIDAQLGERGLDSMGGFDGYESDRLVPVDPLCYAVLAAFHSARGRQLQCRRALRLVNQCYCTGAFDPPVSTHGTPRRTLVLAMSTASLYLHGYGLMRLAAECASIAAMCEAAVTDKANARGGPAATVPHIRHLLKRSAACQLAAAQQLGAAVDAANESILAAQAAEDVVEGHLLAARLQQLAKTDTSAACDSYLSAIKVSMDVAARNDGPAVPLEAYLQVCKLLINSGRFAEAYSIGLSACSVYPSAALLLLLGVCCLRLDRSADAEHALQESNLLDNRNCDTWAYLAVLCLCSGSARVAEAEKALAQALRLGLASSSLLRELATLFMAVDRLQVAEELLRRAIALEVASQTEGGRANPRTRKLLADVLASQNEAAKAVEEYSVVISDDLSDISTKLQAADKCQQLLASLGRQSEAASLAKITSSLKELGDLGA